MEPVDIANRREQYHEILKMEPLGVLASVIAIYQAGDRLLGLIAKLRRVLHAHDDIRTLHQDIGRLKLVLDALTTVPEVCNDSTDGELGHIIGDCHKAIDSLEALLSSCLRTDKSDSIVSSAIIRTRWLRRRQGAESQRQQLRDSFSTLGLYLQIRLAQDWYRLLRPRLLHAEALTSEDTQGPKASNLALRNRHQKTALPVNCATQMMINKTAPSRAFLSKVAQIPSFCQPGFQEDIPACTTACGCTCHQRKVYSGRLRRGSFGSYFWCQSGSILQAPSCTWASCKAAGVPYACVLFLPPLWISRTSLLLAMSHSPRLRFSLSFPRLLPPDHEFFMAIRSGRVERMKELLTSGNAHIADIAAPFGLSALHMAVIHGQAEASQLLIAAGSTQLPSHWNWSPTDMLDHYTNNCLIHSNLSAGNLVADLVKILAPDTGLGGMKAQTEVLGLESGSLTRIHKAVLGLSLERLEDVRTRSTLPLLDEVDSCNRTPLYWAVKTGNTDAVRQLLAYGANPFLPDFSGASPLHIAAGHGNLDCLRLLISHGVDLECRDRLGATPLHCACAKGNLMVIDALVVAGADIEGTNCVGETPIFRGNHARKVDTVRRMVELGASLHHRDAWGSSPLHDAIWTDSHEALEYLLTISDCTTLRLDGKTILHTVGRQSDQRTIEILLRAGPVGIDPHATDHAGFTALEYLRQRSVSTELFESFCALVVLLTQKSTRRDHPATSDSSCPENKGGHDFADEETVDVFEDALPFQP